MSNHDPDIVVRLLAQIHVVLRELNSPKGYLLSTGTSTQDGIIRVMLRLLDRETHTPLWRCALVEVEDDNYTSMRLIFSDTASKVYTADEVIQAANDFWQYVEYDILPKGVLPPRSL